MFAILGLDHNLQLQFRKCQKNSMIQLAKIHRANNSNIAIPLVQYYQTS